MIWMKLTCYRREVYYEIDEMDICYHGNVATNNLQDKEVTLLH